MVASRRRAAGCSVAFVRGGGTVDRCPRNGEQHSMVTAGSAWSSSASDTGKKVVNTVVQVLAFP